MGFDGVNLHCPTEMAVRAAAAADGSGATAARPCTRVLRSSTFRLNVTTLCGVGGAFRG